MDMGPRTRYGALLEGRRDFGGKPGTMMTNPLLNHATTCPFEGSSATGRSLLQDGDPWLCGPASRRVCLDPSRLTPGAKGGPESDGEPRTASPAQSPAWKRAFAGISKSVDKKSTRPDQKAGKNASRAAPK